LAGTPPAGLDVLPIVSERLVALVPADHPLARRRQAGKRRTARRCANYSGTAVSLQSAACPDPLHPAPSSALGRTSRTSQIRAARKLYHSDPTGDAGGHIHHARYAPSARARSEIRPAPPAHEGVAKSRGGGHPSLTRTRHYPIGQGHLGTRSSQVQRPPAWLLGQRVGASARLMRIQRLVSLSAL
jgi:hypothetical protein